MVPVVRRRSIGCPVTRLFHEYGSATRVPGVTAGGGGGVLPTTEPYTKKKGSLQNNMVIIAILI